MFSSGNYFSNYLLAPPAKEIPDRIGNLGLTFKLKHDFLKSTNKCLAKF